MPAPPPLDFKSCNIPDVDLHSSSSTAPLTSANRQSVLQNVLTVPPTKTFVLCGNSTRHDTGRSENSRSQQHHTEVSRSRPGYSNCTYGFPQYLQECSGSITGRYNITNIKTRHCRRLWARYIHLPFSQLLFIQVLLTSLCRSVSFLLIFLYYISLFTFFCSLLYSYMLSVLSYSASFLFSFLLRLYPTFSLHATFDVFTVMNIQAEDCNFCS